MLTNLQKWGNSHGVRIPSSFMKELGWKKDDQLLLEMNSKGDVILRKNLRRQRADLFSLFRYFEQEKREDTAQQGDFAGWIIQLTQPLFFDRACESDTVLIAGNDLLYQKTGLLVVCPVVRESEPYPLHIAMDERCRMQGMILCEYLRSIRIAEEGFRRLFRLPEDLLCRVRSLTLAELDGEDQQYG